MICIIIHVSPLSKMSSNKVVRVSYTQDEEYADKFKPIEAEVKKTCGEPGSLNFLFGIPLSMAKISDDEEEDEESKLICKYCKRNEEECEEQTENEKNPITEWRGWGLSCDDCYYENHPESDSEDEE